MAKSIDKQEIIEVLKGARTVDFITPVLKSFNKYEMVKEDASSNKSSKAAKEYLEQVEQQYRTQLSFLYEAANQAFPEDKIKPSHAFSSLGPSAILEKYEFRVIVSRKEEEAE